MAGNAPVLVHNVSAAHCDLPSPEEANFPSHSGRKTAATSDSGETFQLSGWSNRMPRAYTHTPTSETAALREEAGLAPQTNGNDQGVAGQYYDSHAERQSYARNGGDVIVDRDPCGRCQEFFTARAVHEQRSITVSHPSGVTVFQPTGDMDFAPR